MVGTPPDAFASAGFAHPTQQRYGARASWRAKAAMVFA
jgi:hypothetical protein